MKMTFFGFALLAATILNGSFASAGGIYCQKYSATTLSGKKATIKTVQIIHSLWDNNIENFTQVSGAVQKECDRFMDFGSKKKSARVCGVQLTQIKSVVVGHQDYECDEIFGVK